jgi:predicted ATPase/serine phosphatase RsbU (regulator of sigma subunit)
MLDHRYHFEKLIEETDEKTVYKAIRIKDSETVRVCRFKGSSPKPADKARFFKEYEDILLLAHPGILKTHDVFEERNGITAVTEYVPSVNLAFVLKSRRIAPRDIVVLSIRLAEALECIHGKNLVHGNINPTSLLLTDGETGVKLSDFAVDSLITGSRSAIYRKAFILYILPYMSPEQTGRMNRTEDYRSDFYSLGMTLFEAVTGITPFRSQDPLELIHCHIARKPVRPEIFVPELISPFGDVLLKLMAKSPEERYQSATGLKEDLLTCRDILFEKDSGLTFTPGKTDIPTRFILPQTLYGREKEKAVLIGSFKRVYGDESQLLLVSGEAGIGKSALIHEIHKPIVEMQGYFTSGKFEHHKAGNPYSAVIQAFSGFFRQILSENESSIKNWRKKIKEALGGNTGVLAEMFPGLELIVGSQPPVIRTGPEETRNRFNLSFESLLSVFANGTRPLVLFLDDLQWADFSSLNLISHLVCSRDIRHVLFILAYRSDEVEDTHPFMEALRGIEERGIKPDAITVGPLSGEDIGRLVADFLKCGDEKGRALGEMIFLKTAGNPFFINQFLTSLHDSGKIRLEPGKGWTLDKVDILSMDVTDNVVTLMAEKISGLSGTIKEILKTASCIGNRFELETLASILGKDLSDVLTGLKSAMESGLAGHSEDIYHFIHDRVQEAAYSLIDAGDRPDYHLRIGRFLLKRAEDTGIINDSVLTITDHLNHCLHLIGDPAERARLFALNMESGKKTKSAAALGVALNYFKTAENLLPPESFSKAGDDVLSVFEELADTAALTGDYGLMDLYIKKASDLGPPLLHRVAIGEIEIRAHFARQNHWDGIRRSIGLLSDLGVPFPKKVSKLKIIRELIRVKRLLAGMSEETLLNLPLTRDPKQTAVAKIYFEMGISANLVDSSLYGYIVLKRFAHMLTHGLTPYSGICFVGYGAFLAFALSDFENAGRFGRIALRICERPELAAYKYRTHTIYVALISHWCDSTQDCIKRAAEAYRLSREAGDQIYTGLALTYWDYLLLVSISNIPEFRARTEGRLNITRQSGQRPLLQLHDLVLQHMVWISQPGAFQFKLTGKYFKEEDVVPEWIETNNYTGLANYYAVWILIYYNMDLMDKAHETVKACTKVYHGAKTMLTFQLLMYLECLVLLAKYPSFSFPVKMKTLFRVKKILKKIKRWAEFEPTKHTPWIFIIEAEIAAVKGRDREAQILYDRSFEAFNKVPSPLWQCLAMMRACRFYKSRGLDRAAGFYRAATLKRLREIGANLYVSYCMKTWSEDRTVDPLERLFHPDNTSNYSEFLDMSSMIKGAQALSGIIEQEQLLKTVMAVSLESAGAQKGFLVLHDNDELIVCAEGHVEKEGITLHRGISLESCGRLAASVVNYAARSKKPVVLANACVEGEFIADPYIAANNVKSLLASPMVSSGQLRGVIYLENNLSTMVFSEERIRVLDILASQAAISIENARLFDGVKSAETKLKRFNLELEERVDQRTRELKTAYDQIMAGIRYSGIIQHSLLPDSKTVSSFLPESFFIWKPRDIVGGDIYACESIEGGIIVAVIDCTGHGVPGAFMTMLAGSALRRLVREEGVFQPADVLKRLNRIVKTSLQQDRGVTRSDDGLDAGVCYYDRQERTLVFAGARIPLYIAENGQITVVKGDKESLGYTSSSLDFTFSTHCVPIPDQGKTFYLFTDGLSDQLGEKDRTRFGSARLKKTLLAHLDEPFEIQKEALITAFQKHKGAFDQTDDITFAGFRFT